MKQQYNALFKSILGENMMNIKKLANSVIAVAALTLTCGVTNAADSIDTRVC